MKSQPPLGALVECRAYSLQLAEATKHLKSLRLLLQHSIWADNHMEERQVQYRKDLDRAIRGLLAQWPELK